MINAKRVECRHRAVEMKPTGGRQPLRLLHGRPLHHHQCWPGCSQCHHRQAVGAQRSGSLQPHPVLNPSRLPRDNLEAQARSWEQSTHRMKTLSLKERFEEILHRRCLWHPKSKHSAFEYQTLQRALRAPPLNKDYEER
jgi:hypothetical protein